MSHNKVYIVGVGPGSSDYLTWKARETLKSSDVVAGFEHSLNTVKDITRGKKVFTLTLKNEDEVLTEIAREAEAGKTCSLTFTGDPMFSDSESVDKALKILGGAEIIPGISSVQLAASKSNLALDKTAVLTFHVSGDIEEEKLNLLKYVKRKTIVLLLPRPWDFMPNDTAKFLITNKVDGKTPVTIYENLTMPDEKSFHGILKDVVNRTFSDLSVVIIGN